MAVLREILTDWTTAAGSGFVTVMYFFEGIAVEDQREALNDFWTGCRTGMSDQTGWVIQTSGKEIEDSTGALVDTWADPTAQDGDGAFAGEPVPDATQLLVRWNTPSIIDGRFLRGRTFIPGFAVATVDNGDVAAASLGPVQTAAEALIASAAGLAIWSRPRKAVPDGLPARAGSSDTVTTALAESEWAVLRRRRK